MATVGRLKGGDLMLAGEINERLPAVTNGLAAHFPFDGTEKGISNRNLLNYSTWVIGSTGSQTGFSRNGEAACNSIILDTDPFGVQTAIWQSLGNDATSDDDGGWNSNLFPVDATKTYRFSVWIQRKVLGDGSYYFGCNGCNASGTNIGVLHRVDGTTNNTNPYFRANSGTEILGDWFLLVGHVWAAGSGAGSVHVNTGVYKRDGTKVATPADFIWNTGTTQAQHRSYLYYSTLATTQQLWCYPRVDILDGSEPTLNDLLMGINNGGCVINPTDTNVTITDEGITAEEATTNIMPSADKNSYPTYGNTHGTYNTNQYNSNTYFSIGTIGSVTNNIVTLSTVGRAIYTYDVLRPQTTGGGVTAGVDYFVKKLSATTFSLHAYDSSQDGSKGFKVYDSIVNDVRVPINATSFPTMWFGAAHLPNSALVKEIIPFGFKGIHDCIRCHGEHKPEGEQDYMAYSVNPSVTAGTVYTFSFWVRAATPETIGKTISFSAYTGASWTLTKLEGSTTFTDMKWHRLVYKGTAPNAGATSMYFPFGKCGTVDIAEIQCEALAYNTSLTLSSRSKGQLSIPNIFTGTTGSIRVRAKMNNDVSWAQSKCLYGNTWSNNAFFVFTATTNGLLYGYYPNNAATPSHSYFSMGYTPVAGDEIDVVTTWNGTTFKYYLNGVLKGTGTDCDSARIANSFTTLYIGSHPSYNCFGLIRSVSIYNRALTDVEITKLYDIPLSVRPNGDAYNGLIELPNDLPSNARYFPLADTDDDFSQTVSAAQYTNVVTEDGSAWVGSAVTNEYAYPTFNSADVGGGWSHWGQTGATGTCGQNTDCAWIYTVGQPYSHWIANAAGATGDWLMYQSPAFAGGYRSLQTIVCMSDGSAVTNSKVYPAWNAGNGGLGSGSWSSIERIGDSKWYLCKAEGFSQDGTNDLVGIYIKPGYKAYFDRVQLEQKPFCSPFANGTRGQSSIEFNLYNSLRLDWSKDWTIVYWKKPVGTHTDNKVGYNLESLGCNSNSVGGGYVFWGKTNAADTIYSASPGTITPADYFGKWHMISLSKNSSGIAITEWNIGGVNHTRTAGTTTTVANYYVTQYGYDFKLGGWDDANASNAYYRDLIVIPGTALTSTQLEKIHDTFMRVRSNGTLQVQGQLVEGVTL